MNFKAMIGVAAAYCFAAAAVLTAGTSGVTGYYSLTSPRIDGRLDDAVWGKAPAITDFQRTDGKTVERKTEAKIIWTPNAIVFGFKAYIPKRQLVLTAPPPRDKSATSSDCVEIMLDPSGGADSFKHFIVNASGGIFDRACEQGGFIGDEKWDAEFTSAVAIEPEFWSCEIAIPYRSLGITKIGKNWTVNLCRESFGSATAPREISSIAKGAFNVAGDFLPLTVPEQMDFKPFMLDLGAIMVAGSINGGKFSVNIDTDIKDWSGLGRDLRAECAIAMPKSLPLRREIRFTLAPASQCALNFSGMALPKPGLYAGIITIRDQATNRILFRRDFPVAAEYTPITVKITDPHYRNTIFATQKLDNVRFAVELDLPPGKLTGKVTGGIRTLDGKILASQSQPAAQRLEFEFPAAPLPEAKLEVFADFGKDQVTVPLRKLAYKSGEVWRGKDGNWYRDGKKLFINAAWNHLCDYYDDYNIMLGVPKPGSKMLFYNPHPYLGLSEIRPDLKRGLVTPQVLNFYRKKIDMCKDDPRLFGHFLCDEPDVNGFTRESFEKIAAFITDLDPWHPIMICPGSSGLIDFAGSAELSAFHCYPRIARDRQMANFDKIVYFMDKANAHFAKTGVAPTVTYTHQGFDYSDSGNTETRVPSYDEFRNQNLLTLILGGKGFMHYNRGVENFPELYLGMPALAKEQRIIGNEAVIQPDAVEKSVSDNPELRILAKRNAIGGAYWVLVCNTSQQSGKYRFSFAPFADRQLQVLSENRTVKASSSGQVSDEFTPFQVHVYTTDRRDFGLKPIAEINAAIAKVYTERRRENAGNLVYQEYENDAVKVTASSNKYAIFRVENSLWHVADGVTTGSKPATSPHGSGIIHWCDATPNVFPDWIELEFKKTLKVGRVEVYSVENSLKDYEIQLRRGGRYETVGKVENATGVMQTISFPPLDADGVRLYVTSANGAHSKVYEIKVFAQ